MSKVRPIYAQHNFFQKFNFFPVYLREHGDVGLDHIGRVHALKDKNNESLTLRKQKRQKMAC